MFAVHFSSMHVDFHVPLYHTVNPGSKSPYALCLLNHCSIIVILKKTGVEFGITGSRIWLLYLFRWLLQMRTYFCLGGLPPWILSNKIFHHSGYSPGSDEWLSWCWTPNSPWRRRGSWKEKPFLPGGYPFAVDETFGDQSSYFKFLWDDL